MMLKIKMLMMTNMMMLVHAVIIVVINVVIIVVVVVASLLSASSPLPYVCYWSTVLWLLCVSNYVSTKNKPHPSENISACNIAKITSLQRQH